MQGEYPGTAKGQLPRRVISSILILITECMLEMEICDQSISTLAWRMLLGIYKTLLISNNHEACDL
jgi:hypothetical protein